MHDAVTSSDLGQVKFAHISFLGQLVMCIRRENIVKIFVKFRASFRSLSSCLDILVCASIALTKRDCYVSLSFTIVI